MTHKFNGTKVFLALRPDIYGVDDEHVTVEYLGNTPDWNEMLEKIVHWEGTFGFEDNPNKTKRFPTGVLEVKTNGYANWCAKNEYHHVALVGFPDNLDLSFSKNWHITLESAAYPLQAFTFDKDADAFRYDHVTELWVGYKDADNNRRWVTAKNAKHLVRKFNVCLSPSGV
jgi:hypothetical protein